MGVSWRYGGPEGFCETKSNYNGIGGAVSPLTNEKDKFNCAQLEVYKVIYDWLYLNTFKFW